MSKSILWREVDPTAGAGVSAVVGSTLVDPTPSAPKIWVKTGSSSTAWTQIAGEGTSYSAGSRLVNIQTLTANGTYTPTAGTTAVRVWGSGGGGAGGSTRSAGNNREAGGGGSSGVYGFFIAGFGASVLLTGGAVVVGAGGTAVAENSGNNGSESSIVINGTTYTFPGGSGGASPQSDGANSVADAGRWTGTPPTNVDYFGCCPGTQGLVIGNIGFTGSGGGTTYGTGGIPQLAGNADGYAGSGIGSGGSGACQTSTAENHLGGDGAAGGFIVEEYT